MSIRGRCHNINKNISSSGRSKFARKFVKVCWKCGKEGNYKKNCKPKTPEKGKGYDDAPSIDVKTTSDEGGDVYLVLHSNLSPFLTVLVTPLPHFGGLIPGPVRSDTT